MMLESKKTTIVTISLLFFFSGFAALIYQVLWIKELSLLFGNSTQATAATLAAFFTGIAAGNAYWGRRSSTLGRPLMAYGMLELCITLSAVLYFTIYIAYDSIYPFLFSTFANQPAVFTLTKFILALLLFFPSTFFMGGTFPVMTQYFVQKKATLGKRASLLYAINTFGAASGALVAGVYLPQTLGIDASYILAMLITFCVALIAIILGRTQLSTRQTQASPSAPTVRSKKEIQKTFLTLAALSGFASLALQVLWVRMFVQVLHNSVYTYSVILSVFLIALTFGSAIARELARRKIIMHWFLPLLLTVTALLIAGSAILFEYMTGGGAYISGDNDFIGYLLHIFFLVTVVIGLPTTVIGVLLPYLFKLTENQQISPGETVGRLVTVNTLGAISGSIIAGFILLEWIGLWASLKTIALLYLIAALSLSVLHSRQSTFIKLVPVIGILLLFTVLDTNKLSLVRVNEAKGETLLKVWEGSDATVAVVEKEGQLRTKLNNWYTLGGTGDMVTQQIQTHLPMLLHPNPKKVFYLGLGTGITAGTSLSYKTEEIVIAELAPSVIQASKEFFTEHTNNLYNDPRVTVIAEDGRNVLRGTQSYFDLIISDLFIPWKAGTGTLYSVEHYQSAKQRLNKDGLYVQWLPLYQLTQEEFEIIAKSMLEVFPNITMWRGNFWGDKAVMALVGHQDTSGLTENSSILINSRVALNEQKDRVPLLAHYVGSFNAADQRFATALLNTDTRPVIEYLAPINHRREKAGEVNWFVGFELLQFISPHLSEQVLAADPYLTKIDPAWYSVIQAGYYLQTSFVLKDHKHKDAPEAKATYQGLLNKVTKELQ